ncbi:MAG: nitrilase-related carbon-nitrogen hydrolase, partial [Alphaproteobacteria bacterium]
MAAADRLVIAVCQMGPVERGTPKRDTVARLVSLLETAAARGARFCVFPEIALTTFFPRWVINDPAELDACFESDMPNPDVQPLFERARALGTAFALGYGERADHSQPGDDPRHYNTMALVDDQARVTGTYRKVHVPGTIEPVAGLPVQHMEKRYFRFGDKGFPVWP